MAIDGLYSSAHIAETVQCAGGCGARVSNYNERCDDHDGTFVCPGFREYGPEPRRDWSWVGTAAEDRSGRREVLPRVTADMAREDRKLVGQVYRRHRREREGRR